MSYKRRQTGDSLNDWFSEMVDFNNIAPHLLTSQTDKEFKLWVEQLVEVNKRALFFYLRQHLDEIPPERIDAAQWYFARDIRED